MSRDKIYPSACLYFLICVKSGYWVVVFKFLEKNFVCSSDQARSEGAFFLGTVKFGSP